jgi:hypothetical protein
MTLLTDGRALVAGGITPVDANGNVAVVASAEIFNPASGTWAATGSMGTARYSHTATLLSDGRVLAAGGASTQASAEIFNPASGTWVATGSMTAARRAHTATLLSDGRVLAAGRPFLASAEIFTP